MDEVERRSQENEPLLPIGAAVERLRLTYPDVSHSSLRFLEREGFLQATRTAGGHRLYSSENLKQVLLIKGWQQQGATLEEIRRRLETRAAVSDLGALSNTFLELALARELEAAQQLVLDADTAGVPPEQLFFQVLKPALIRLGALWEQGIVPVHQEKEVSEIAREIVAEITLRHAPDYPSGPLVLSACVEGERHEIGLRMINGLLRQVGYRVRYLGADVATEFLLGGIRANQPEAVLLSASLDVNIEGCRDAIAGIDELYLDVARPPIVMGGDILTHRGAELAALGAIPVHDIDAVARLYELIGPPSV